MSRFNGERNATKAKRQASARDAEVRFNRLKDDWLDALKRRKAMYDEYLALRTREKEVHERVNLQRQLARKDLLPPLPPEPENFRRTASSIGRRWAEDGEGDRT